MNWLVWKLHRKQFFIFGVLLAIFAVFAILTGNHFWHTYQNDLSTCSQTNNCSSLGDSIFSTGGAALAKNVVTAVGIFVPLLLGVFLGSPLLAREYEEGTNKLVWTQSISRYKWLSVKLLWALGFAFLYGAAITILTTWWSRTSNTLYQNRFDSGIFNIQGLTPAAYTLFFTSAGFMAGAWSRKTLVALAITIFAFILFQVGFAEIIRPHYMQPVTVTSPMGPNAIDNKIPSGAWILNREIVDKYGKTFNSFNIENMPPQCQKILQQAQATNSRGGVLIKKALGPGDPIDSCLNRAGYHQVAKYQPNYRYWDFQEIESGIYLGLSAIAVAATYWLVLKRDA